jgi:hypothetical protein
MKKRRILSLCLGLGSSFCALVQNQQATSEIILQYSKKNVYLRILKNPLNRNKCLL